MTIQRLIATILFIAFVTTSFAQKSFTPQIEKQAVFQLGVIDHITSAELGETRTLNIYLPEGYSPDSAATYPVIYLLDGAADEDFIHIVGLVQYNTFPWIDRIPRSIVVGIANTDRKRDFTYPTTIPEDKTRFPTAGGSAKFIAFLQKELQPFIEKRYKTTKSKTLIGQSLGGLLATEILFKHPTLFDKYIIISPSLWWDNGSLLQQQPAILQADFKQETAVYIGVGKEGMWPGMGNHVMEVDANILADKLKGTKSTHVTVYFDYLPQENHATASHPAVFNAFRLLYPAK